MESNNKENIYQSKSVKTNIIWKFLERGSSIVVTLVVNIILARLLDPSSHGLLTIVMVFVSISEIFVTSGLGSALIQKKETDSIDFSSIFWLNIAVSLFLYLVLFFLAPVISDYYGIPDLSLVLRVLSIKILICALNSIQCAYIARNMMFKYLFLSTLVAKIVSGVVGICLAFCGAGVWALVAQSVSISLFETLVLWLRGKWKPSFVFSWKRAKGLYSFAYKVMLSSLIESITDQSRNLIIGKKYSSNDVAFYDKGVLFPNSITTNVTSSLSAVIFPVLSHNQDDDSQVLGICSKWVALFSFCMLPVLTWLAISADEFIPIFLTEKWNNSILYIKLACLMYASWVVEVPIRESIKSIGRSDVCLRIQIIKTVVSLVVIISVMSKSVLAIAVSSVFCSFFNILLSCYFGNKHIGYTPKMVVKDIIIPIVFCTIMAICMSLAATVSQNRIVALLIKTLVGFLVYCLCSVIFKNKAFLLFKQFAFNKIRK